MAQSSAGLLVSPSLLSGLKYFNNPQIECQEILYKTFMDPKGFIVITLVIPTT